jgi:hypothetical protein
MKFICLLALSTVPFILFIGCPSGDDDDVSGDDDDTTGDDDDTTAGDDDVADDDSAGDHAEVTDMSDVMGRDYLFDLGSAQFVEPEGVGLLLAQYMADVFLSPIHIQAIDEQAGVLEAFVAHLGESGQDMCLPTTSLTDDHSGRWDNPFLALGPTDYPIRLGDGVESPGTIECDGWFAPDGSSFVGATVSGSFDMRALHELVDPGAEEGAACDLFATQGIECETCPSDGEPYCLSIRMEQVMWDRFSPTATDPETGEVFGSLLEVTQEQVDVWTAAGVCP